MLESDLPRTLSESFRSSGTQFLHPSGGGANVCTAHLGAWWERNQVPSKRRAEVRGRGRARTVLAPPREPKLGKGIRATLTPKHKQGRAPRCGVFFPFAPPAPRPLSGVRSCLTLLAVSGGGGGKQGEAPGGQAPRGTPGLLVLLCMSSVSRQLNTLPAVLASLCGPVASSVSVPFRFILGLYFLRRHPFSHSGCLSPEKCCARGNRGQDGQPGASRSASRREVRAERGASTPASPRHLRSGLWRLFGV